ncbi:DNA-binding transcriptional regulator HcaR [Acinetobacter lwoffii]|jgi:LysR family transcriptional regulator, hca operon transcriptional activator|uniref:DNA-binding transcriptional regulator HcaR n=1 Tax=Acinetobacter lwoffii TaxID=28090 RepID=A0AAJ4P3T3_ACILW|nr:MULTISPECIES: DNA-binding transcriptional regulator HcaR [Pseudomonadota]KGH49393.1 RpiR family transcriptional regulator [Acinetobacter idrijaensis]AUC06148.1 DNA-binding transcriptional regulator HcaR [Acinetobacter lwoffii]MBA4069841.1 RpiR family transcriptional regulator [Acinetobacter sp.]MBB6362872.1 LysR family hca operon transcriptional activator [Acinetobacter lwoffii]MCO8061374.1 DNA-binding transcriptional regulator HcaR [Acinetobacter lwoffii]
MELRHLRYFITVAEELNFSKAALKLYTAQPSLSQQIKDLEEDVGVKLLNRTKRKVELTEEGAVFLEQARLTLAQADKAVAMARQVSQAKQQMLRIGFVPVAEMKIFPYILPNLRVQNPDLKIELLSLNNNEQMRLLKKGDLDLTFTRHNFNSDEIESQFVIREPLIFLLPKDHPLAKYERIPVKALNGIDFIIPSAEQSLTLNQAILDFAKANGIELNIVQKADNILFNINSIGMGLGCTILPGYIAPLTMDNTVIRPLDVELPYLDLYVSYHKNNKSYVVSKFLELLTRVFYLDINRSEQN